MTCKMGRAQVCVSKGLSVVDVELVVGGHRPCAHIYTVLGHKEISNSYAFSCAGNLSGL